MPFQCPQCQNHAALEIVLGIELPPDGRSDEITLQVLECGQCVFSALAIYEESRRGALDRESVDHQGYRVDPGVLAGLRRQIEACPAPGDARCDCPVHRLLGQKDAAGRWIAPAGLIRPGFPILYSAAGNQGS